MLMMAATPPRGLSLLLQCLYKTMLRMDPEKKTEVQEAFRFFKQNPKLPHEQVQEKLIKMMGKPFVAEAWKQARKLAAAQQAGVAGSANSSSASPGSLDVAYIQKQQQQQAQNAGQAAQQQQQQQQHYPSNYPHVQAATMQQSQIQPSTARGFVHGMQNAAAAAAAQVRRILRDIMSCPSTI